MTVLLRDLGLGVVQLHGFHAVEGFLQISGRFRECLTRTEESAPNPELEKADGQHEQRNAEQQHYRELPAEVEHHGKKGERLEQVEHH